MKIHKDDIIFREKQLTTGAVRVMETIIQQLTSPACHNRSHGTQACRKSARVIENCFISLGLKKLPGYNKFSLPTPPWSFYGRNVFGIFSSNLNSFSPEGILVVAHHDIFRAKRFAKNVLFQGADDNASGVALLCATAANLKERKPDLERQVFFLSTTGEEQKWIGAKWAVTQLRKAKFSPVSVVAIDMVGRSRNGEVYIGGVGTSGEFKPVIETLSGEYNLKIIPVDGPGWSGEEKIFYENGYPSLFVTTGRHQDYHTMNDLPEHLNFSFMIQIGTLVSELVEKIANFQSKFNFRHVALTSPIYQESIK